jgi:hypothetical protein
MATILCEKKHEVSGSCVNVRVCVCERGSLVGLFSPCITCIRSLFDGEREERALAKGQ